jgi:putative glutamine amidotransferase
MTRHIVSCIWEDGHPFNLLDNVNGVIGSSDPNELNDESILVVHGGADIHPSLYNKGRSSKSGAYNSPSQRDLIEWEMMKRAAALNIPIIGICRGAQMLCALAGGFLVQHVNNHGGNHRVVTHDHQTFLTNSMHHQMMYPFDVEHEMIAWMPSAISDVYYDVDSEGNDKLIDVPVEPEFVYFPTINGYAIQWHPEMMSEHTEANRYTLKLINARINANVRA